MEKGHAVAPGSNPRLDIDKLNAGVPEADQVGGQVGGTERHVVKSRSSAGQEAAHGGVGAQGLQEFHLAYEGDPYALGFQGLGLGTLRTGEEFEEGRGFPEGRDGDGDVVQRQRGAGKINHEPW